MPKYDYDFASLHKGRFKDPKDIIAMREGLTRRANDRGERIVSAFVIGEEVIFIFEKEVAEPDVIDNLTRHVGRHTAATLEQASEIRDKGAEIAGNAIETAGDIAKAGLNLGKDLVEKYGLKPNKVKRG